MSSASSISLSLPDSQAGSYMSPPLLLQDPRSSDLNLGNLSDDGGDQDGDKDSNASNEPAFNFRSLAEVVGVSLESENAGRRLGQNEAEDEAKKVKGVEVPERPDAFKSDEAANDEVEIERSEDVSAEDGLVEGIERSVAILKPVAHDHKTDETKQKEACSLAREEDASDLTLAAPLLSTPVLTITPDTPAASKDRGHESKQLGYQTSAIEHPEQATQ